MTEREVVDFLESCNFETREPTKNFIELKEEYDTKIAPRRKALKKLGFLRNKQGGWNETLKMLVIAEEQQFNEKLLLAGEVQKYFFSEDLRLDEKGFFDEINQNAGIMYPFRYSAKLSEIPSELYETMKNTDSKFFDLDGYTQQIIKTNNKFYDFAYRAYYRTDKYRQLRKYESQESVFINSGVRFCKFGKIVISYYRVGEYIYFVYN